MKRNLILEIAATLSITLTIILLSTGRTTAVCPLPNCADCTANPSVCTTCNPAPGTYGTLADGSGCDDCQAQSSGTCTSCTTLTYCDSCASSSQGPVSGTTTASCGDCASNCQFCQTAGAGQCDAQSCDNGYGVDASQTCSPCAAGCTQCSNAGAGGCDNCPPGEGLNSGCCTAPADCAACVDPGCQLCTGDNTICDQCLPGYTL